MYFIFAAEIPEDEDQMLEAPFNKATYKPFNKKGNEMSVSDSKHSMNRCLYIPHDSNTIT
jgi:hypothetical protein